MKVLRKDKWSTYGERMAWRQREAFCRTFGHGAKEQKGLRNPVWICLRCRHGVTP